MRDNRLICRIVAGALLIASLLTAGLDLEWRGQIREAQAADAWPSVQGTVRRSAVEQNCGKGTRSKFYPDIRYDYQVNSLTYHGGRYALGLPDCGDAAAMHAIADRFVEGQSRTVWYKPGQPSEATLTVGKATSRTDAQVGVAEGFLAVAILLAAFFLYQSRSD